MDNLSLMRSLALGSIAALCLSVAAAAELSTADFTAACSTDVGIAEDPAFDDGKVTPKAFCECVAGELVSNKLTQKDVDMLTKLHKEEISDEDAENFATLEDLLNANEGYEDSCRQKLGLPIATGTDMEGEEVPEGEEMPDDAEILEDEGVPAEDDGSPPE